MKHDKFDLIVVGTGFASSFFLYEYLSRYQDARVLVLERGPWRSLDWQITHRENQWDNDHSFVNRTPKKQWRFSLRVGGGSNCWWACTPRMMPEDFEIKTRYGVGQDWPVSYDDLEECYCQAEELMSVSGPDDGTPYPRSRPYPQPPHRFNAVDRLLKKAFPDTFIVQPCARPREDTDNRAACCASGVCNLCPIDSKFTVINELPYLLENNQVTLVTGAVVQSVDIANHVATGVNYLKDGQMQRAGGDLVVLGANAIFNPHILLRSGLEHPLLGKRLTEQVSINVRVDLDGLDSLQGSTSITGHGYMLYPGAHRAERAAALMESWNLPRLRDARGKWRQIANMKFIYEDLPQDRNSIRVSDDVPEKPVVEFHGHSSYAQRGIDALAQHLPRILEPLPVENVVIAKKPNATESHIMGTTTMGTDPTSSVVDRYMVHHDIRNLIVPGTGCFPTAAPANPTLTLCALTLWSAKHLLDSA